MLEENLLEQVENQAQYVGAERNMVVKDPQDVDLRVAIGYPDLYQIGMSHVGLHILYHVINQRPDAYCERVFLPRLDAVGLLKDKNVPLRAIESGDPLQSFDVIGLTLQYELTFTGVLGILDLAQVPRHAADRTADDPIVLGGGPCAYNPEPVAPFFDAFVIGDGEEAVNDVLDVVKRERDAGRDHLVRALADIDGVYVPAVHDPAADRITRRIVPDLDDCPFPTAPPVPWAEIVHDRGQVEIARGCTRGCRFCQAGYVYRPVRERSKQTLLHQAREIIDNTGYDELSLTSLNCPDYTDIEPLLDMLADELANRGVSIGLPSLRIDNFSVGLAEKVQRVRKSGLTFAPEAGSQRLRDAINKGVTERDLFDTARAAFEAGWHTIKLYFMIGMPTETDEDVLAIAELTQQVADLGRRILADRRSRMQINVSVATLVPKAHTPMQWSGQIPRREIIRRQRLLRDAVSDSQIRMSFHDPDQSVLEAALARGDRPTAAAIAAAYDAGCIFDGWSEHFEFDLWQHAFQSVGMDLQQQAEKTFQLGDPLPWDHIRTGVRTGYLLEERRAIARGEVLPDCRIAGCHRCGIEQLAECETVHAEAGV